MAWSVLPDLSLDRTRAHAQINEALNYGIDINIKGPQGYTPLFQAVFSHRVNAVKLLLKHGADATKRNDRGFNPLDAAAFSGCDHCTHLLLKHGVNPHLKHPDGYNALHRAIWGDARATALEFVDATCGRESER